MSAFRSNQKVIEIDLCNSEEEDEGFSPARLQHNASNIVSSNDAFDSSSNVKKTIVDASSSTSNTRSSMRVARKIPAASSSRILVSSSSATPIASSSSNSMINEIPNNSRSTPVASSSSREPLNSSSRSSAPSSSKNAFDIDLTAESQTSVDIPYIRPNPSMYVEVVTSVFPDAQLACITKLLKKYGNDVDSVVQDMISNGYEKVEIINVVKPKELDYRSTSWVTSTSYREVALSALSNDFPFIHVKSIGKIFENNNYHYYPSLAWLEKELKVERYSHSLTHLFGYLLTHLCMLL